jgi:hypothetical protein
MVEPADKFCGCLPLHSLCQNIRLEEHRATEISRLLLGMYPESVSKQMGRETSDRWWSLSLDSNDKQAIDLTKEQMLIVFTKVLLLAYARTYGKTDANNLQLAVFSSVQLKS